MILKSLAKLGICILVAFALYQSTVFLGSSFLVEYLKANLTIIAIAILAINSATLSIVLVKIRELIDESPEEANFSATRREIEWSFVEQIIIICLSLLLLTLRSATKFTIDPLLLSSIDVVMIASFLWLLYIVYDTAMGVLILIDFRK